MITSDFKIIFMGTPEFAVGSLSALLRAGFNIVAVVTAPDKPAGRGQKLQESDVKLFAKNYDLPVLQPEKLKDPNFISQLKEFDADLFVVVAFRMLPEIIWSMPRLGTINLHGSLLPHYRGAAPINWAVINGETETGVTTFFIEREIDTGKIIYSDKVTVEPSDNGGTVHDKLMITGANLLVKTVIAIQKGNYPQIDQMSLLAPGDIIKTAPKIFKENCKIDWSGSIHTVQNFIRGLSPYPAAWTVFVHTETNQKYSVKIFSSEMEIADHPFPPKTLFTDNKTYVKISVNGGFLSILNLQVEGKKKLPVDEFLRGFKMAEYTIE